MNAIDLKDLAYRRFAKEKYVAVNEPNGRRVYIYKMKNGQWKSATKLSPYEFAVETFDDCPIINQMQIEK